MHERLVASIYAAATEPERWPSALEEVRVRLGLAAVNLIFVDPTASSPPLMLESGHDPEAVALWGPRAAEDPNLIAGLANPGRLVWSERVMDRRAYAMDPFVNEVMRPGGLWHVLGHVTSAPDAVLGAGVHRPQARPFFAAEVDRIGPLLRHLGRAMQVHNRLTAAADEKPVLADLLDHLRAGAVLLDRRGGVVLANRTARALAAAGDGVSLASGLAAATADSTKALQAAILQVGAGMGSAALSLPRPSGREPYRVLVVPLAHDGGAGRVGSRRAAILVLLTDPEPRLDVAPETLRAYFGFTAAEARVAAELLAGTKTPAIVRRLGVTSNTLRVHVRHILEKTGTSSRTELVAKIAAQLPEAVVTRRTEPPPS